MCADAIRAEEPSFSLQHRIASPAVNPASGFRLGATTPGGHPVHTGFSGRRIQELHADEVDSPSRSNDDETAGAQPDVMEIRIDPLR